MEYRIRLIQSEEGWAVSCPALPGCHSQGATRAEARQLVSHCAIKVNGELVNIPSYQVAAGDKIEISEKAKAQPRIKNAVSMASQVGFPEWVEVDDQALVGTLKNLPARDDILPDVNENLVVELYSK